MANQIKLIFVIYIMLIFVQANNLLTIPYCNKHIIVDGLIDDWKKYSIFNFEDTLSKRTSAQQERDLKNYYWEEADFDLIQKPVSRNKVQVYSFWNKDYINFAFIVHDAHLFSCVESGGNYPKIYLNDGIEIYIDTQNDSKDKMDINDYQFLIDQKGQRVEFRGDRQLFIIDTIAIPKDFGQNIFYTTAIKTFSKRISGIHEERGYIVEIAIPFFSIGMKPKENDIIKLDLCNNDLDMPIPESALIDKKYALGWSFNWSGQSDFGYPEFWKEVSLVGHPSFFERLNHKYHIYWFFIFIITLFLSISVFIFLVIRMWKLQKMPSSVDIQVNDKISFESTLLSENQQFLKLASDYIQTNHNQIINSEQLSKSIGTSLRKLQRVTREEMKCTPTNFIYMIKLSMAADYLSKKMGNISQAAYEFGFNDPAYFSKLFKKHFGISPKEYQESNTEKSS